MRKSTKELTGLTAKEHKILGVLLQLSDWYNENKLPNSDELSKNNKSNVKINRYDLTLVLNKILAQNFPISRHTISSWIKYLLARNIIIQNPTSHLDTHNEPNPTNKTKYFININKINSQIGELISKRNNENNVCEGIFWTHTQCLDKYM